MSNLRQTVNALGPAETELLMQASVALAGPATAALGISLTANELASVGAIRDHVLSPDGSYPLDVARAIGELREIESVKLKLKAASSEAKARRELDEYAAKLSPSDRLTWARQNLPAPGAMTPAKADAEAAAAIKDRSARIAAYRAAGGTK